MSLLLAAFLHNFQLVHTCPWPCEASNTLDMPFRTYVVVQDDWRVQDHEKGEEFFLEATLASPSEVPIDRRYAH